MKSLLSAVLLSSVVSLSACGGDRETVAPSLPAQGSGVAPTPPAPAIVAEVPVETATPVKIDEPIAIPSTFGEALELGKKLAAKGEAPRAKQVLEAASKLDRKRFDESDLYTKKSGKSALPGTHE